MHRFAPAVSRKSHATNGVSQFCFEFLLLFFTCVITVFSGFEIKKSRNARLMKQFSIQQKLRMTKNVCIRPKTISRKSIKEQKKTKKTKTSPTIAFPTAGGGGRTPKSFHIPPGGRTPDLQIRSLALYPTELVGRINTTKSVHRIYRNFHYINLWFPKGVYPYQTNIKWLQAKGSCCCTAARRRWPWVRRQRSHPDTCSH